MALPFDAIFELRREVETSFGSDAELWRDSASSGLVETGFDAVMEWLKKPKG